LRRDVVAGAGALEVTTDLVVVTHGIDPAIVRAAIPPSCVTGVSHGHTIVVDRYEAVIEMPPYFPRSRARSFVPSLALLDAASVAFRFELSVRAASVWSPWTESVTIGSPRLGADWARATMAASQSEAFRCDVDVFSTPTSVDAVRARVRVRVPDVERVLSSPLMFALSVHDLERASRVRVEGSDEGADDRQASVEISVPPLSQMEASDALARRICSPACVAMILQQRGRGVDLESLAAEMLQPDVALYGVWPAAIAAAARRGIAGYVLRFPDWAAARWCLDAGLPIVASVRYAKGKLTGAAIEETPGHLIVLRGYAGDEVLVNDPAAPTRSEVSRRYARTELERVWLDRAGIGYVFFEPLRD